MFPFGPLAIPNGPDGARKRELGDRSET